MRRSAPLLLAVLVPVLSLMPQPAMAYSDPETVLVQEGYPYAKPLPTRLQQAAAAEADRERVQRIKDAQFGSSSSAVAVTEGDGTHAAAPEETNDGEVTLNLSNAQARAIARIIARGATEDTVLHAGAPLDQPRSPYTDKPLTPVGPAGPIVAFTILAAAVWTLTKAGKRKNA